MSETDRDYEVGYGKPPKSSRFKKGQSGNPRGRPKGAKSLRGHIKQLLDAKMTISDANGRRKVSTRKAMAMRIIKKAIEGDPKAIQVAMSLDLDPTDDVTRALDSQLTATELRIIEELFGQASKTEQAGAEREPTQPRGAARGVVDRDGEETLFAQSEEELIDVINKS